MNNLFFLERPMQREMDIDMRTDKKAVRDTIKLAIDMRNQQEISESVLKTLVKLAMAYEIAAGIDEKINRTQKNSHKILR